MMFDDDLLYDLAGNNSYQKARQITLSGAVNNVVFVEHGVEAKVKGTAIYKVSLYANEEGQDIEGQCTCPAAEYQALCKHCVALGMYVNRLSSDDIKNEASELDKLKSWLNDKSHDELLEIFWRHLSENTNDRQKWLFKMNASQDRVSSDKLKRLIRLALPEESLWGYQEVSDYFEEADEQFEVIFEGIDCLDTEQQWELSLYALEVLAKVLEEIDDSYGYRFGIEGSLTQRLYDLFNELDWSDAKKATWLFEHTLNYGHELFPSVPGDFKFSDVVEEQYLDLCSQEIECQVKKNNDEIDTSLFWPLIKRAKKNNDWREECRLKQIKAKAHRDWLELSEICLKNSDELEAEHWLIKAKQVAKFDHEKKSCTNQEIAICIVLGEHRKAWKLGWMLFDTEPSFNQYQELKELKSKLANAHSDNDYLAKVESRFIEIHSKYGSKDNSAFFRSNSNDAIVEFYLDQQQIDKARNWVKQHQASRNNLLKLADLIVNIHGSEAIELYHRSLRSIISETNNAAYEQATKLLHTLKSKLNIEDKKLFDSLISSLQTEFKLKRNMMKLLKENFSL